MARWTPHAEQQIGRVDRIDSLWDREARDFMTHAENEGFTPRITVRPVVVKGTYSDYHRAVLSRRWGSMRALLNGDTLPGATCDPSDEYRRALIDQARDLAPDFSPVMPNASRKK